MFVYRSVIFYVFLSVPLLPIRQRRVMPGYCYIHTWYMLSHFNREVIGGKIGTVFNVCEENKQQLGGENFGKRRVEPPRKCGRLNALSDRHRQQTTTRGRQCVASHVMLTAMKTLQKLRSRHRCGSEGYLTFCGRGNPRLSSCGAFVSAVRTPLLCRVMQGKPTP